MSGNGDSAVDVRGRRAILIYGIAPRSGTNYLYDLFLVHPQVGACAPVWEDYLTFHADALAAYAGDVATHWHRFRRIWDGQLPADPESCLLESLGDGLLRFLGDRCERPVMLTKTPSPRNLDLAPRLFPRAAIVILQRDGRAVVESAVRSGLGPEHGNRYDVFMRQWATAAQTIINFRATFADYGERFRIVRYEDLIADLAGTLPALLDFCALPRGDYDMDRAGALPVRGSSTFGRRAGDGRTAQLDWAPKPRTAGFDPLSRFADWPAERHALFNRIAGDQMRALGYELVDPADAESG